MLEKILYPTKNFTDIGIFYTDGFLFALCKLAIFNSVVLICMLAASAINEINGPTIAIVLVAMTFHTMQRLIQFAIYVPAIRYMMKTHRKVFIKNVI